MTRMKASKTKSSKRKRMFSMGEVVGLGMGMAGRKGLGRSTFVELKRNCAKNT